ESTPPGWIFHSAVEQNIQVRRGHEIGRDLPLSKCSWQEVVELLSPSQHYRVVDTVICDGCPITVKIASHARSIEADPAATNRSRVENRRSGFSLPVALTKLSGRRLSPVWLGSVSCSRSSNRTGGFPASGSRKRHTMIRVTPPATSEHNS